MLQPINQSMKYEHLFSDIDTGKLKIPKFQRDFVWSKDRTAKLIDSIIKGFPIGTFILWKTREELRHVKNIGNIDLPDTPSGDATSYVLDGQQRITSLYAVRKGIRIDVDGLEVNYKDIFIDLTEDPDSDNEVVVVEQEQGHTYVSVHELLTQGIVALVRQFQGEGQLEKIETYKNRLTGYDFSTITISDYPLDIACEVFTRINTGGQELTLFEIMVAKTYRESPKFDLYDNYNTVVDGGNGDTRCLRDVGYETIPPAIVMQCVALYLVGQTRRPDILRLDKNAFINAWDKVVDGLFYAVDWLRSKQGVPVSRLLPYNALLAPLTYFFIKREGTPPTYRQHQLLTQFFWWASLSQRYQSATDSKLAMDVRKMQEILKEEMPDYRGEEVVLDAEGVKWHFFSAGDAFCKALLCLYASFCPRSFDSNGLVALDNAWLQRANSKNYHHFFPKSYLRKQGYEEWQANSIINITIVDDFLNKYRIGAQAPAVYMARFQRENPDLDQTMKTHLIEDLNIFGIWDNDYKIFLNKRWERVFEELQKRLYPDRNPVSTLKT